MSRTQKINNEDSKEETVFEKEQDFFAKLAYAGWTPPDDPDERALSAKLVAGQIEVLKPYVESLYASNQQRDWVNKRTWEMYPSHQSRLTRENFLAACVRRSVEPEQLVDLKDRWDNCRFTSVAKKWYVLGTVSVPRPASCTLDLKDEVDISAEGVEVGRQSLSYIQYQNLIDDIEGVRLKIDGDRFVVTESKGEFFLVGYETLKLKSKPTFLVLERYAGEYYVVYPYDHPSLPNVRYEREGQEGSLTVRAHPWIPKEMISRVDLHRTKYEGVMILARGKEYRAKWVETAETLISDEVWEVMLEDGNFKLLKPRPGKTPSSQKAAKSMIGWAIPGRELLQTLTLQKRKEHGAPKPVQTGAKVLFLSDKAFYLIRDGIKPLDLIGGTSLVGEIPLDTAVREIFEETKVRMTQDMFVEIGTSSDETDDQIWTTTLFLALIPAQMKKLREMRAFVEPVTDVIKQFYRQKGVAQIWTIRLLEKVQELGGLEAMRAVLVSHSLMDPIGSMRITQGVYPLLDVESLIVRSVPVNMSDYDAYERAVAKKLGPILPQMLTIVHSLWTSFQMSKGLLDKGIFSRPCGVCDKTSCDCEELKHRFGIQSGKNANSQSESTKGKGKGALSIVDTTAKVPLVQTYGDEVSISCSRCAEIPCLCPRDVVRKVKNFPDSKIAIKSLLREIMKDLPEQTISAQTLYKEFSRLHFPGTRLAKIKFMDKCLQLGYVTEVRFASGRVFKLVTDEESEG
jgi:ADP-ribose pyrophosphatase YjhB (NUDIX family)